MIHFMKEGTAYLLLAAINILKGRICADVDPLMINRVRCHYLERFGVNSK
jgi:hypothetical protein